MSNQNVPGLGIEFEVFVPAYFSLNLIRNPNIADFTIESNAKGFGNIDDLIIDLKLCDGRELFFAFQLKHANDNYAKLYANSLWAASDCAKGKKSDFKIIKYCKSLANLTPEKKKYHIILYTNRNFDSKEITQVSNFNVEAFETCPGQIFFDTSENKTIYRFDVNDSTEFGTDLRRENYVEFFKKFSLYVSQKNSKSLEEEIEKIFSTEFHAKSEFLAATFISFIRKWHKKEFTDKKLGKQTVLIKLIQILLADNIEYDFPLFKYDSRKLNILKRALNLFDVMLINNFKAKESSGVQNCSTDHPDLLRFAKDFKLVNKWCSQLNSIEEDHVLYFTGKRPMLIKIDEASKNRIESVLQLFSKNRSFPLKLIICNDNINCDNLKVFRNLEDVLKESEELFYGILDNYTISLQGRQAILLRQLVEKDFAKVISADELFNSVTEHLALGDRNEEIAIDTYVPRIITTVCFSRESIAQLKSGLIIINCDKRVEEIHNHFKYNTDIPVYRLEDFNFQDTSAIAIILTKCEVDNILVIERDNIHFFTLVEDSFQWTRSRGDIQSLKRGDKYNVKEVPEKYIFEVFSNNVNVICAQPGMGKSIMMQHLANNCPPNFWSIKIDLREYNFFFAEFENELMQTQSCEEKFFKQFIDKHIAFSSQIKNILLEKKLIYFFFDGLDELQFDYIEAAIKFMNYVASRGFKIWISARNSLRDRLESNFCLFTLNIQEFSKGVQKSYIRDRLNKHYDQEKIQAITDTIFTNAKVFNNSEILGIPLQLLMLTEIMIQNKQLVRQIQTEKMFIMTEMYESFLEGKIKHYLLKHVKETSLHRLESDFRSFHEYFEIAGLKSCLDPDFYKSLKINESAMGLQIIEDDSTKMGIIRKIDKNGIPVFEHNTHGEYFAACYFAKNFESSNLQSLFNSRYNNIRLMFDIKLAEESPAHLSVIYRDIEKLKCSNINCKDKGGRTPLHLACCYGQKFPILQVVNKVVEDSSTDSIDNNAVNQNKQFLLFLINNKLNPFNQDQVFKWDPFQYADVTFNLLAIEIMSQHLHFVEIRSSLRNYQEAFQTMAYYSAKFDFRNIFEMIKTYLCTSKYHIVKLYLFFYNEYNNILQLKNQHNQTLLHIATENRNLEFVKLLLEENVEVNPIDNFKCTPLDIATLLNEPQLQKCIEAKGGICTSLHRYKQNPLHLAAKRNFTKIAQLIVNQGNIDINSKDDKSCTALHYAAKYDNLEVMEFLINAGADLECITIEGETPLYFSVCNNKIASVRLLLEKGVALNTLSFDSETLLHCAVKNFAQESIINILLKGNIDVNSKNSLGLTPLHLSIKYRNFDAMCQLIGIKSIDINVRNDQGETPLHYAAATNFLYFNTLLENGADLNAITDTGDTILHSAVDSDDKDTINYLLKQGLNVDAVNKSGNTPLHCAAAANKLLAIVLIGEKCSNPIYNNEGLAPIHVAIKHHNLAATNVLLSLTIDNLNLETMSGETPLFYAVFKEYLDIVDLLVKKSAKMRNT